MAMHEKKHGKLVECFEILKEPALSDCQATIADTSNDIHVLISSPCQNSGNFMVNTSCHYVITALYRAHPGQLHCLTILEITPYLCTIDPQNLAEALVKCFFTGLWNDSSQIAVDGRDITC